MQDEKLKTDFMNLLYGLNLPEEDIQAIEKMIDDNEDAEYIGSFLIDSINKKQNSDEGDYTA